MCGGDSSLEGLSGSPCSSDMILAVPPPATLLLFYPLHPFTCFRASQHRQRTLLNISQRYHSSPLYKTEMFLFSLNIVSRFFSPVCRLCARVMCCVKRCSLLHSQQSWARHELLTISCCLLDFSLACVLVHSAAFRTQR